MYGRDLNLTTNTSDVLAHNGIGAEIEEVSMSLKDHWLASDDMTCIPQQWDAMVYRIHTIYYTNVRLDVKFDAQFKFPLQF